jgi:hypothetical protein
VPDERPTTPAIERASPEARAIFVHALATATLKWALAELEREARDAVAEPAHEPDALAEQSEEVSQQRAVAHDRPRAKRKRAAPDRAARRLESWNGEPTA